MLGIALIFAAFVKTELVLGEITSNLDTFKVFHILTVNSKLLHQLNDKNYKRLAVWARIIIAALINYATPFFSICLPSIFLSIAVLTKQFYWSSHFILFSLTYINTAIILATTATFFYIYFPYYKLRFDQLNQQLKSIIPNRK